MAGLIYILYHFHFDKLQCLFSLAHTVQTSETLLLYYAAKVILPSPHHHQWKDVQLLTVELTDFQVPVHTRGCTKSHFSKTSESSKIQRCPTVYVVQATALLFFLHLHFSSGTIGEQKPTVSKTVQTFPLHFRVLMCFLSSILYVPVHLSVVYILHVRNKHYHAWSKLCLLMVTSNSQGIVLTTAMLATFWVCSL